MIYAGVNGYLDKFEVARVRAFESGLLTLLRTKHADLLDSIRKSGDLSSRRRQAQGSGRRLRQDLRVSCHGRACPGHPR